MDSQGDHTEELRELAGAIQHKVNQFLSLSLTIVISEDIESISDLHARYMMALDLSNERFLRGTSRIFTVSEDRAANADEPAFQYPEEVERLLLNELRLGHEKEALQHLSRFMEHIQSYSFANARLAIMMLLVNISKTITQMKLDTDIPVTGSLTQLDQLMQ
ncbi:hypothetical protein, partial [Mycobacterium tuberculosis]